jgi:hypothetical protein
MQTTAARPAKPRAQPPSANFFPEDFGTCFAITASNDANECLLEVVNRQFNPPASIVIGGKLLNKHKTWRQPITQAIRHWHTHLL